MELSCPRISDRPIVISSFLHQTAAALALYEALTTTRHTDRGCCLQRYQLRNSQDASAPASLPFHEPACIASIRAPNPLALLTLPPTTVASTLSHHTAALTMLTAASRAARRRLPSAAAGLPRVRLPAVMTQQSCRAFADGSASKKDDGEATPVPVMGTASKKDDEAFPESPTRPAYANPYASAAANAGKPDFDLIVVGSGPAAQACAVSSSRRGKRVAVIDKPGMLGGVCVNTGTIPSKTFREAVLHLTGYRHQGFYGKSYAPSDRISMEGILHRVSMVVKGEKDVMRNRFRRYGITHIYGTAQFTGEERSVQVTSAAIVDEEQKREHAIGTPGAGLEVEPYSKPFTAEKILVAVGTTPARRPDFDFDGEHIIDSDDLLSGSIQKVPRELIVVGAGVIGMEYASMFNVIPGSRVTVIDGRPDMLTFADKEIIQSLEYEMRQKGARFLLGEEVLSARIEGDHVIANMASGKVLRGDCLLYTVGRQGNTAGLGLEKAGLEINKRGLLTVNDNYQTSVPWLYAAGDCIGFPALASTSSQQGRMAAHHMWGEEGEEANKAFGGFPYGIYTIPEISMVGYTEQQLTQQKIPYEMGVARYDELAKGQMMGGSNGMLKILFHAETLKILGVHCMGESATEIVHVGQVAMDMNLDMHFLTENVFNYPTFAESYRVAAFNGLKRLALAGYTDLSNHGEGPGAASSP